MSQFKRSGQWVAKFVAGGQQHWVPGGPWPTKAEARRAEERFRVALEDRAERSETCQSWSDRWLIEFERPGPATQRQYANAVARFTAEFGGRDLDSVTKLEARTWALSVPRSVSRVIGTMYADAVRFGVTGTNPFSDLRIGGGERKRSITAPTLDEYHAVLAACSVLGGYGPEMRRMIQFAAWTGIRQGELFALRWQDIDEDREIIRVRRSRKLDGSIGKPKNGREREILWPAPAQVLADHSPRPTDDFLFHSPEGRPLLKGTFAWSWSKVRAAADTPQIRWHDWRHFCATQLLEAGVDHFAVSVQLGHTDGGQLVMSRYGHPSHDRARDRLRMAYSGIESGSGSGNARAVERTVGES
jgi:integrase